MVEIDRILKAKIQLQKKNPFFAHILLGIRHERKDDIPKKSACIDIHGNMKYNKPWIDSLTDAQIETVMEHEALHLILEHLKRRKDYLAINKIISVQIWKIAEDLVINDILVTSGMEFPEGIVPDRYHSYTIEGLDITIKDIHKKTAEFVYDEIIKQLPTGNSGSDGEPSDDGEGEGDEIIIAVGSGGGQGDQQDEEGEEESKGDQGESEEDKEETEEKEGDGTGDTKEEEELTEEEKDILDKLPQGWDEHERDEDMPAKEQEREIKRWRQRFITAVELGRMHGNLPSGMDRRCQELFKEKLNWYGILYRFVSKAIAFDYTWLRPARKSHSLDVYLPGLKGEKIELIVSVDTSGSITDKDLTEFVSEMVGIARSFQLVDILAIVCDCKLTEEPLDIRNATPDKIKRELKLKGGGGTSHVPVFDWINENKPNTRLLVALTDGATTFPDRNTVRIPTIWILGGTHRVSRNDFPFGQVIEIPKYED